MRTFFIFLVAVLLCGSLYGQSPLEQRIDLEIVNLPLNEALYRIIDTKNVKLSFSNRIIPENHIVNYSATNQTVGEILDGMLSGTSLTYKSVGSQIVIFKIEPDLQKFTISGFIRDLESGESVIGAIVYDDIRGTGTYSNEFGFFSLTLLGGHTRLIVSNLGYEADTVELVLSSDRTVPIDLQPVFLTQIVVESISDSVLLESKMGTFQFNMNQLSKLPSLGGEPDILRLAYTLPGLQTGADGFGGLAVRGGNVDQNLFLLDGVPIYNATHGLGIFSVYNSSAVKSAKIIKGAFPARYGGRISSVWDIRTKEGNSNEYEGEMDMGLSSATLTFEGPLGKGNGSFFFSGRRSFFDYYSQPITRRLREDKGIDGYISYYFFDLNLKSNYQLSEKDRVYISYYRGRDLFLDKQEQNEVFEDSLVNLFDEEDAFWGNTVAALRWNHKFSNKLFGNATVTFSRYLYESEDLLDFQINVSNENLVQEVVFQKYNSTIQDKAIKLDFDYSAYRNHHLKFGANIIDHTFRAGIFSFEEASSVNQNWRDTVGDASRVPLESTEFDFYVQDEMNFGKFASANIGLRSSALSVNGKWYLAWQPRILVSLYPFDDFTLNLSASRVVQFLHLLSPSSLGLPKDLWVSATESVPPQYSWQFSSGIEKKFEKGFSVHLEGYYKWMKNLVIFKETSLDDVTTLNWVEEVSIGEGRSFGLELLLQKHGEKAGAYLGYTWNKADRQFPDDINFGNTFPTRLDRRHNLSLQFLYRLNKRWELGAGAIFSTGNAFNVPTQTIRFEQPSGIGSTDVTIQRVVTKRNGQRLPHYHRLDFSANYILAAQKNLHTLKLGVYNVYNRRNPLYITFRDNLEEDGSISTEFISVSLLPVFPTLRYVIQFK